MVWIYPFDNSIWASHPEPSIRGKCLPHFGPLHPSPARPPVSLWHLTELCEKVQELSAHNRWHRQTWVTSALAVGVFLRCNWQTGSQPQLNLMWWYKCLCALVKGPRKAIWVSFYCFVLAESSFFFCWMVWTLILRSCDFTTMKCFFM